MQTDDERRRYTPPARADESPRRFFGSRKQDDHREDKRHGATSHKLRVGPTPLHHRRDPVAPSARIAEPAEHLGIPADRLDTPPQREIALLQSTVEKVVVSDSLTTDGTDPWRDTTRIVRRPDAHAQIVELKRRPGAEILAFGSRTLWNDLLAAGLVDELHLMVGPVVLGAGTPAFGVAPAEPLSLLGTRTFDGSDNLLVRYATTRVSAAARAS